MNNVLEKCVAILAMALIAIVGLWVSKSSDLAAMAIGAIAGLAGSGIADIKKAGAGMLSQFGEKKE